MPERTASLWTIAASVSAAVLAAAILGGVGGVLQIPTLITDVATLRVSRDDNTRAMGSQAERIRSTELEIINLHNLLDMASRRQETMLSRLERKDEADRTADIATQRELQAVEGRSHERNTEVKGQIQTLDAAQAALSERFRVLTEALATLRRDVFELAVRQSKSAIPPTQGLQREGLSPAPFLPPTAWPPSRETYVVSLMPCSVYVPHSDDHIGVNDGKQQLRQRDTGCNAAQVTGNAVILSQASANQACRQSAASACSSGAQP